MEPGFFISGHSDSADSCFALLVLCVLNGLMSEAKAVTFHENGKPADVLRLEERPTGKPGHGEVLIALRRAVIHPSDLGMIAGTYGRARTLPAVAGREGVGEIVAVGPDADTGLVGAHVRMPEESGAWAQAVIAPAEGLTQIPQSLSLDLATQAFVNPTTAYRVLHDYLYLQEGDWIIQNAGNSAVGVCVAGLARSMGVHCISVVRDVEKWEPVLKEAGARVVLAEGSDYFKHVAEITGGPKPKLALNSIGGESVMSLIKSMAGGGIVVTFGGMVGDKVRFPTRELIFNDLTLRGFWMDRWFRQSEQPVINAFMDDIYQLLENGIMQPPVDQSFPFDQALQAVQRATESGRLGKVLLASDWSP